MKKLLITALLFTAIGAMAETVTNAPAFDSVPGLNLLPEKLRGWVLALIALSPFIGRAYHAVSTGGGFRGIVSALWLGTNAPKKTDEPPKP